MVEPMYCDFQEPLVHHHVNSWVKEDHCLGLKPTEVKGKVPSSHWALDQSLESISGYVEYTLVKNHGV